MAVRNKLQIVRMTVDKSKPKFANNQLVENAVKNVIMEKNVSNVATGSRPLIGNNENAADVPTFFKTPTDKKIPALKNLPNDSLPNLGTNSTVESFSTYNFDVQNVDKAVNEFGDIGKLCPNDQFVSKSCLNS